MTEKVDLDKLCLAAARAFVEIDREYGLSVIKEMALESIGGFSNLYLGMLLRKELVSATWFVNNTFIPSKLVAGNFLQQIGNCTGLNIRQQKIMFNSLAEAVYFEFRERHLEDLGSKLHILPLGVFRVSDLNAATYYLTYTDPACAFLL